jgi:uncharacterized protein with PQ loop repeat
MMMMMMMMMMIRRRKVSLNKFWICNTALEAAEETQLSVLTKHNKAVTTATSCTIYSTYSYLVVCIQITVDQLLVELVPICEPAPHLEGVKYCCTQTPFL